MFAFCTVKASELPSEGYIPYVCSIQDRNPDLFGIYTFIHILDRVVSRVGKRQGKFVDDES